MFKKSPVYLAMLAVAGLPLGTEAETEVSAVFKSELAGYINDGQKTGEAQFIGDTSSKDGVMKWENSVRVFMNNDLSDEISAHLELRPTWETEAIAGSENHKAYSQNDWFREGYADIALTEDWDLRAGKQQIVWGTADGIKLLDIVNPTDFTELNQNGVEDARIPIFMLNAEGYLPNDLGNLQLILSESRENNIAGLNADGPVAGHPFVLKGVDTITGPVNGFLNIAPNLGSTATQFQNFAPAAPILGATGFGTPTFFGNPAFPAAYNNINGAPLNFDAPAGTPGGYAGSPGDGINGVSVQEAGAGYAYVLANGAGINLGAGPDLDVDGFNGLPADGIPDALQPLNLEQAGGGTFTVQDFVNGATPFCFGGSPDAANDLAGGALGPITTCGEMLNSIAQSPFFGGNENATRLVSAVFGADPDEAFEYMNMASFATFDTFSGIDTVYERDYPRHTEPNLGTRLRRSTDGGVNYSVNYFWGYDHNPAVDISWRDAAGNPLMPANLPTAPSGDNNGNGTVGVNPADFADGEFGAGSKIGLLNPNGTEFNPNNQGGPATLVFTESVNRVHNLGGSFDAAIDRLPVPLVLRGEFLYQKDVKTPVIDRNRLAVGDLANALKSVEGDYFKYVIGLDATVLTNMLVSGQFIQFINMDYVHDMRDENGVPCATPNCGVYTGDQAVLALTNGMRRGYETKEFYSLFVSKPFGEGQRGRFNNIIIYEEGGGWWDRIDAEYTVTDNLIVGGELNFYWGNENTTFGQFENSSNAQVTIKYITD